jgi:ubiquinone/menaquinone biosynthesis C-methylase UbiE
LLAPIHDWVSGERLLLAAARARAIDPLRLRSAATVLDVACGTGLNFALIEQRIGPAGRLVGIDRSARMLRRARALVARRGWETVQLVQADAEQVFAPGAPFDAVLCTLGLSVIPDWRRPGARC